MQRDLIFQVMGMTWIPTKARSALSHLGLVPWDISRVDIRASCHQLRSRDANLQLVAGVAHLGGSLSTMLRHGRHGVLSGSDPELSTWHPTAAS